MQPSVEQAVEQRQVHGYRAAEKQFEEITRGMS